jgi:hypothetical protein
MNARAYDIPPAPPNQAVPATPDITLSGATVDKLMQHLSNATVLIKATDGMLHPHVDPRFVIAVLGDAVKAEWIRLGVLTSAPEPIAAEPPQKPN